MPVLPFRDHVPKINSDCFIAPTAMIIGDVEIGSQSSVWFGTVIRGDNSVIHVTTNRYPTIIGNNVTIGHSVTLHGCTIKDNALVGIGSIVMDQSEIAEWSILAAGSVLKAGTKIPSSKLWGGTPAKEIRDITEREREWIKELFNNYISMSKEYLSI